MPLDSDPGDRPAGLGALVVPAVVGVLAAAAVLAVIVASTPSVWQLLGAGRGLVPERYYPVVGYVIVLATTVGQAVGWAGASAVLYHVLTAAGVPRGSRSARIAMSVVYVAIAGLPLLVYHALFGGPLLGLPRAGLNAWLLANHPDAHGLLVSLHPVVDLSVIPLGAVFLGVLWLGSDQARAGVVVRTILALAVVGTALVVALSLVIHATIVHIGPG
ncbi:MAG: hypothetical protein ACREM3_05395 [Candidatus Rokuibacteriota bacterium]